MPHYYHILIHIFTKKSTAGVWNRNVSCTTSDLLKFRDFSVLLAESMTQKKQNKTHQNLLSNTEPIQGRHWTLPLQTDVPSHLSSSVVVCDRQP